VSLFGFLERRSLLENPAVPLTDLSLASWLSGPPTDAGIPVNEISAMNFSAVYRCVSLISGLGGALPIKVYKEGTKEPVGHPLIKKPHPDMPALEFWRLTYAHRALLQPRQVVPQRVAVSDANPWGKQFKVTDNDGKTSTKTPEDIFHLPGLGYDGIAGVSPIRLAAQGIGLALGAEKYAAKLFGSGNLLSGLLQTDQKLNQTQAETLKQRWFEKTSGLQQAHQVAVMDAGAKFQSMTMPNDDAEMLASRQFQLTELGRYYGIPPFLLFDHTTSTTWGSGLEQIMLGFLNADLHPTWLAPTEGRITSELLPDGLEAAYDMRALMRGDSVARANYFQVMFGLGALNANEVRFTEDLPPVPGGDEYLKPTVEVDVSPTPVIGAGSLSDSGTA